MLTQEQLELINQLFKRAEQSSLQSGTIRIKDFSFSFEQKSSVEHHAKEKTTTSVPKEEQTNDIENHADTKNEVALTAPLLGIVRLQPLTLGQSVTKGQVLCQMEAMKLLHDVVAPTSGTLSAIHVQEDELVSYHAPLFTIQASEAYDS